MTLSEKARQELIDDMLFQYENREHDFAIDTGNGTELPVRTISGIVHEHEQVERYRGIVLEINDHGNVTVWKQFLNGNRREIASRV